MLIFLIVARIKGRTKDQRIILKIRKAVNMLPEIYFKKQLQAIGYRFLPNADCFCLLFFFLLLLILLNIAGGLGLVNYLLDYRLGSLLVPFKVKGKASAALCYRAQNGREIAHFSHRHLGG